jgi:hypothetical protein
LAKGSIFHSVFLGKVLLSKEIFAERNSEESFFSVEKNEQKFEALRAYICILRNNFMPFFVKS